MAEPLESPKTQKQDEGPVLDVAVRNDVVNTSQGRLGALKDALEATKLPGIQTEEEHVLQEIGSVRDFLKEKYDVELVIQGKETEYGPLRLTAFTHKDKLSAAFLNLKKDISKLPPKLIEKIGLKKIIISKELYHTYYNADGKEIVPLDGATMAGNPKMYLADVFPFHHELFHMIDALLGGQKTDGMINMDDWKYYKNGTEQNSEWASKNPATEEEQSGQLGDEYQAGFCSVLFNRYESADYQEWYEEFMAEKGGPEKFELMKKWLLEASDGKLNEQYWKDLEAGKVDEDYWKHEAK
ncbi:hypothetical protein KBD59_03070 [Candidatus Gracilibacteria bacterium]|nr:hypothetical protein [Candidatus Gracilibacteria bacterium]